MLSKPTLAAISVVAYTLLITAAVPNVARHQGTWALLPVWLLLVGYVSQISKHVSDTEEEFDRYARTAWLAYLCYFVVKLVWPYDMHWYEVLAVLALFLESGSQPNVALLLVYYVCGAVTYASEPNVLQVLGRSLLALAAGSSLIASS